MRLTGVAVVMFIIASITPRDLEAGTRLNRSHSFTLELERFFHVLDLEPYSVNGPFRHVEIVSLDGNTVLYALNVDDEAEILDLWEESQLIPVERVSRKFSGPVKTVGFFIPSVATVRVLVW